MERDAELQRYKEPLTPLAGPYGHPFHAVMVTVPIGAWSSSLLFDLLSRSSAEPRGYAKASADLIKTGIAAAAGAAVFGFLDYLKIPRKTVASRTATTHLVLNGTILLLYAINAGRRDARLARAETSASAVSNGEFALSAMTALLLLVSGWLGGELSYRYGVRVADEATQREGLGPA